MSDGYNATQRELEILELRKENTRLRGVLTQFVACCDTAPPTSLMIELGMVCKVARAALVSPAHRGSVA